MGVDLKGVIANPAAGGVIGRGFGALGLVFGPVGHGQPAQPARLMGLVYILCLIGTAQLGAAIESAAAEGVTDRRPRRGVGDSTYVQDQT